MKITYSSIITKFGVGSASVFALKNIHKIIFRNEYALKGHYFPRKWPNLPEFEEYSHFLNMF